MPVPVVLFVLSLRLLKQNKALGGIFFSITEIGWVLNGANCIVQAYENKEELLLFL